ncbi:MAG: tRNA pseudouridine(55) synthase TruB [Myxococcota bacterium]
MKAGFLVIDKPEGITSHDVVAAVRAVTGAKKVGHTGTLDPFATGVLPLAIGFATRLIQFLDESLKVYDATIALGTRTDTGDPTGTVDAEAPVPELSEARLLDTLAGFVGPRMQTPPAYSAVKKNGKPLYEYARKGETVEVAARPITIHGLDLVEWSSGPVPSVRVRIHCSRGTYARVLANEIAEALGTVGHLSALARDRSGPFEIGDALSFQALSDIVSEEPGLPWDRVLLSRGRREERVKWKRREDVIGALALHMRRPLDCLSHLPLADVDSEGAKRVRDGGDPTNVPSGLLVGQRFLVAEGDRLIAVAERAPTGCKVLRVL